MATIMIVEDNKPNIRLLRKKLQQENHDVLVAGDGQKAIEKAQREAPDLIFMDLSLPDVDGWEATRRIKDTDSTEDIPVIALSAHSRPGDRDTALQAGCEDYLTKPVDFDELFQVLNRQMGDDSS